MKNSLINTHFPVLKNFSENTILELTHLINIVYDDAESGMWKTEGSRTNTTEIKKLIESKQLIVASYKDQLVGSVAVQKMADGKTAEFGMLVADQKLRGLGIGSALVARAEQWAKREGFSTIQLELLTPKHKTQSSKEFLKKWYSRIGYTPKKTVPFEIMFPDLIKTLAVECDFTVWLKDLAWNKAS